MENVIAKFGCQAGNVRELVSILQAPKKVKRVRKAKVVKA